jgi:hypothetical protein
VSGFDCIFRVEWLKLKSSRWRELHFKWKIKWAPFVGNCFYVKDEWNPKIHHYFLHWKICIQHYKTHGASACKFLSYYPLLTILWCQKWANHFVIWYGCL